MAKRKKTAPAAVTEGPRIVTLDIETSPLEVYTWGLFDQNVGLDQISQEWSVLSFCAKDLGNDEVVYQDTGGRGAKRVRDDKKLLAALWKVLDSSDIVVGQNVREFDLKKINARMLMHGLPPYSPVRVIDTMLEAKKRSAFTSNKLAWLSKHLTVSKKSEHKKFPGFSLWKECLRDNPEAWAEMKAYNVRDVVSTEQLFLKLRPWIETSINLGVYSGAEKPTCPKCGSTKLQRRGVSVKQTGKFARFQCQECGGWSSGKENLMAKSAKKGLLTG